MNNKNTFEVGDKVTIRQDSYYWDTQSHTDENAQGRLRVFVIKKIEGETYSSGDGDKGDYYIHAQDPYDEYSNQYRYEDFELYEPVVLVKYAKKTFKFMG